MMNSLSVVFRSRHYCRSLCLQLRVQFPPHGRSEGDPSFDLEDNLSANVSTGRTLVRFLRIRQVVLAVDPHTSAAGSSGRNGFAGLNGLGRRGLGRSYETSFGVG